MDRSIRIIAGLIIAVALVLLLLVGPKAGSVDNLRHVLLGFGPWAVAISMGLMIGQAIVAPLPANVLTITNALVFGPVWGAILSWFSTVVGACLCFLLSKTFGKPFAQKIVGGSMQKAEAFFQKYGLQAMFLVRMMPFVPFDAVSYGAPLVGVPFSRFLLATTVGIIPSIFVYSYLGTLIAPFYWWMLVAFLLVAFVALIAATHAASGVQRFAALRTAAQRRESLATAEFRGCCLPINLFRSSASSGKRSNPTS